MSEKKLRTRALKRPNTVATDPPEPAPDEIPIEISGSCDYICAEDAWWLISDDAKPGYYCLTNWPGNCTNGDEMTEIPIGYQDEP